jgi:hypothetical protein
LKTKHPVPKSQILAFMGVEIELFPEKTNEDFGCEGA